MDTWRKDAAETLRAVASAIEAMAEALEDEDGILGTIAGMGLANHLPALPAHIRHTFIEYLSDEEAQGRKADQLYMQEHG